MTGMWIQTLTFYFIHDSDHRALFFDFDVRSVLDDNEVELLQLPYRRLKSSVPKRVSKYAEFVADGWFAHNITEKSDDLEGLYYREGKTEDCEKRLNKIDEVIQMII